MVITVIATGFGDNKNSSPIGSFFSDDQPSLYPMDDIMSNSTPVDTDSSNKTYSEFIDIINGNK